MAASSFREWWEDRRVYEEDGGVCLGEAIWNAALRSVEAKILQSGEAPVQQLKAEIAVIATQLNQLGPGSCGGEHLRFFYNLVAKLRQLSAV